MDLVEEIKAVRFTMANKGYDCAAVDSYLAKLRGDLTVVEKERETNASRISDLEQQIADGAGSSETEGTLRRTLLLAQRLADETEQEAKAAATEMVDAATAEAASVREAANAEAEQVRAEATSDSERIRSEANTQATTMVSEAEQEAASTRASMEAELAESQAEMQRLDATIAAEADAARNESRERASAILETAEVTGRERVEALELTAQTEAAEMRVPIRAEVEELEGVRSQLLTDIAALESHLEAQRTRVKNAVDALRVGMSGSITDLERVAEDEELLGVQPAPDHSGASGADVGTAPDIEIQGRVADAAPEQPTVDAVEEEALAGMPPSVERASVEVDAAEEVAVDDELDTVVEDTVVEEVTVEEVTVEEVVVEEVSVDDAVVEDTVVEDVTVEEVVVEDATVEELGEDAAVDDIQLEDVATEDAFADDIDLEESSTEEPELQSRVPGESLSQGAVLEELPLDNPDASDMGEGLDLADNDDGSTAGIGLAAGAAGAAGGFVASNALSDDAPELPDSGPVTEPIPVYGSAIDDQEIDQLDEQSGDLFGTPMDENDAVTDIEAEGSAEGGSFIKRFGELLDSTPVIGKQ